MSTAEHIRTTLSSGIENGEWFEIIYHGGSNPGARRRIAPIAVAGNKVRARCYTSKAVKIFMLGKIEILENESAIKATSEWRPDATPRDFPGATDVRDIYFRFGGTLQVKGWRVELEETDEGWHLMLYGFFKNGKPRKNPSLVLSYEHTTSDAVFTPEGEIVRANLRPRVRPWSYLGTFAKSYGPVSAFLKDAGLTDDEIGNGCS